MWVKKNTGIKTAGLETIFKRGCQLTLWHHPWHFDTLLRTIHAENRHSFVQSFLWPLATEIQIELASIRGHHVEIRKGLCFSNCCHQMHIRTRTRKLATAIVHWYLANLRAFAQIRHVQIRKNSYNELFWQLVVYTNTALLADMDLELMISPPQ